MSDDLVPSLPRRPGKRRSYLPHELEAGLQALVLCGGSTHKAEQMTGIPRATFKSWAVKHRERLDVIRHERGPQLERMAIDGFRAFILRAEHAKNVALDETLKRLEDGTARDPGRDLSQISVAQGIATQRMLELDGRPQGVPGGERTVTEIFKQLERLGAVVDGSAREIEPPKQIGG
jgi:hypothetical protein